uniref:ABC-type quaternary amine transporter n=1 Tax=Cyanothece sp. (strain PCC 7425 / ATCC 29141) TaxID=395961 RepID=B8HRL9_CYAP4
MVSSLRFDRVEYRLEKTGRRLISDCSFTVQPGELVVILGSSGSGKTTLLKLVNRLYEASSGAIYLADADIRQLSLPTLRRQIGYVIQQGGLFPHLTVASNIAIVPRLLKWNKPKIQGRVEELLDLVGLPPRDYRDRYPAQLSGGQQQRVGLARALAANPQVMLMDEPFGALDALTRTSLQTEILRLQQQLQKTILFVSHDVEEALRLADRILILDRGEIIQFDTPLAILQRPASGFVAQLLGAEDIFRQLSLLRVEQVMAPLTSVELQAQIPQIPIATDLRTALAMLLQTEARQLQVVDQQAAIGVVSLETIFNLVKKRTPLLQGSVDLSGTS